MAGLCFEKGHCTVNVVAVIVVIIIVVVELFPKICFGNPFYVEYI